MLNGLRDIGPQVLPRFTAADRPLSWVIRNDELMVQSWTLSLLVRLGGEDGPAGGWIGRGDLLVGSEDAKRPTIEHMTGETR